MASTTSLEAWTPTRAAGLGRLEAFLPHAGRDYAETRNHDLGPDDRSNVSALSPYLRHRLVLEEEVAARVLGRYSYRSADKFLQEVCWRTYWKGWLELRPGVWSAYRREVGELLGRLDHDRALRDGYEAATEGRTGIACFDAWARELVEVGYLHNHARMWYASLWVFTLGLPWALGADFFFRHLMDGDPASNTLSWRWVAGLQTKGKTYLATAENIHKYTNGRFRPNAAGTDRFARDARPVAPLEPPPITRLAPAGRPLEQPSGLLVLEDDLAPETLAWPEGQVRGVVGGSTVRDRSPLPLGEPCLAFAEGAIEDALARAAVAFGVAADRLETIEAEPLIAWAADRKLGQLLTAEAPAGPARERLDALAPALAKAGIRLVRVRRAWDDALWPNATAGYFPFREKLESSLKRLGLIG